MRPKKLHFIVNLPPYGFDVLISMGENQDEIIRRLKKLKVREEDFDLALFTEPLMQGRCCMFPNGACIIRLRVVPKTPTQYGILHHEITHAVQFILGRVGIKLKVGVSDEAYTYAVGFLTTKIYEKINPVKKH